MMVYLNKTIYGLLNPAAFGILLLAACIFCIWRRRRRGALVLCTASLAWMLIWTCEFIFPNLMIDLEKEYPPQRVEASPSADAIVLLGGGMSCNTNELVYPEMYQAADRVWHSARLWKAGKAPVIITTGRYEADASVPLLRDLGVPDSAIIVEPDARNTEENASFVAAILAKRQPADDAGKPRRILLVTSAWHMRRSVLMFERAFAGMAKNGARPIEIVPAPADYDGLCGKRPFKYSDIFPSAECMNKKSYAFKEILGYWGYRIFRR